MSRSFDLAVVGSGFAGSILAWLCQRQGLSVLLLEKGQHPRFAIGESTTPLSNLLLEHLARRYDLPELLPLCQWGSWQKSYPELSVGLKRGFSFFQHRWGQAFQPWEDRRNQLLVAASPRDSLGDTHWYRPQLDAWLVEQAQKAGVEFLDQAVLEPPCLDNGGVRLCVHRSGRPEDFHAAFLVDATGPRGFLFQAFGLGEETLPDFPATQGLYSHFEGVERLESQVLHPAFGPLPFPVDDAALHHVFPGGWMWILHFNNGRTSAGFSMTDALAAEIGLSQGESAWKLLLDRLPTVKDQFSGARRVEALVHVPRLSFLAKRLVGSHWALLPGAAGFADPLLSTGFSLSLLGVGRLADFLLDQAQSYRLTDYERQTRRELLAVGQLVAALFRHFEDFELFRALSLLYFAAVSYSESLWRLGRSGEVSGFLLSEHPLWAERCQDICKKAVQNPLSQQQRKCLLQDIETLIQPFDVAGLGDATRQGWYPVLAEDLFQAAGRLGASRHQLEVVLRKSGFLD